MKQQSQVSFYNDPLSIKTKMAIAIAEEHGKRMREEGILPHRERQHSFSDVRIIPARVICQPEVYENVPCEWVIHRRYLEEKRVIIYLHGGSWIFGTMDTARPVAVQLVDNTHFRCLMVDYSLAPEFIYPQGLNDCYTAYNYLLKKGMNSKSIGIFGDSAGGNLALALLYRLQLEDLPLPGCIATASPVTDLREDSHFAISKEDLMFTQYEGIEQEIFQVYLGENHSTLRGLPTVSPQVGSWKNMPPLLIHAGGNEAISLDNMAFAQKYHNQGNPVILKVWNGLFHDFTIVGKSLTESVLSMEEIGEFFRSKLI